LLFASRARTRTCLSVTGDDRRPSTRHGLEAVDDRLDAGAAGDGEPRRRGTIEHPGPPRGVPADPRTTAVADVAVRWGFVHSARFVQRYRGAFGERPEETLLR
jgi:hypothetical protein